MREQRGRWPVDAPEALAYRSPVPLVPIACEGFHVPVRED